MSLKFNNTYHFVTPVGVTMNVIMIITIIIIMSLSHTQSSAGAHRLMTLVTDDVSSVKLEE